MKTLVDAATAGDTAAFLRGAEAIQGWSDAGLIGVDVALVSRMTIRA